MIHINSAHLREYVEYVTICRYDVRPGCDISLLRAGDNEVPGFLDPAVIVKHIDACTEGQKYAPALFDKLEHKRSMPASSVTRSWPPSTLRNV